jgi:hypothetical protein
MPRPHFTLRALLVLAFSAAVWTFIAMQLRDGYRRDMGPADWNYINRAKAAAARDQVGHAQKER